MSNDAKALWRTQFGISLIGDGLHICDVKGLSQNDSENEAYAERIVVCVNACDGYANEQLVALAGGNVKREVIQYADKLCEAENRYLKAERQRDALLLALEALLEHEGTVDLTGVGEFPSEALTIARGNAQNVIADVRAKS